MKTSTPLAPASWLRRAADLLVVPGRTGPLSAPELGALQGACAPSGVQPVAAAAGLAPSTVEGALRGAPVRPRTARLLGVAAVFLGAGARGPKA